MTARFAGELLEGKYRLVQPLGQGGMGSVWIAEQLRLGRRVAVKVLRAEFAEDRTAVERLRREATAASCIGNPHIVTTLDFGAAPDGAPFVVLELLEGETLFDALEPAIRFAVPRAADVLCQVLAGLAAAHAHGVVHRDLKPANVFLTCLGGRPDFVKLLDFGLARVLGGEAGTRLTRTGVVLGTPSFMAPEQVLGRPDVDHRADLWAAGVILFRALTGHRPFEGPSVAERIAAVVAGPIPRLRDHRPDLPPALDAAVARALQRDPARRFASAAEFAAALAPFRPEALATYATRLPAAVAAVSPSPEAPTGPLYTAAAPALPPTQAALPAAPTCEPPPPPRGSAPTVGTRGPDPYRLPPPGPATVAPARSRRTARLLAGFVAAALLLGGGGALLLHRLARSEPEPAEQPRAGAPQPAVPGTATSGPPAVRAPGTPSSLAAGDLDDRALFVALQSTWECALPTVFAEGTGVEHVQRKWREHLAAQGVDERRWLPIYERFAADAEALAALTAAICGCVGHRADPTIAALSLEDRVIQYYRSLACRTATMTVTQPTPELTRQIQQAELDGKCTYGLSMITLLAATSTAEMQSRVGKATLEESNRCQAARSARLPTSAAATDASGTAEEREQYLRIQERMYCVQVNAPDPGASAPTLEQVLREEGLSFLQFAMLTNRWAEDGPTLDELSRRLRACLAATPP